jgi:signal transduction histidine kinase
VLTEEALELDSCSKLFETLAAQPPWSELPLIILTTGGESRSARLLELLAKAAGALILLERPIGSATLLRSLEVALNSRRRQYQVRDLLEEQRQNQQQLQQVHQQLQQTHERLGEAHQELADRARQLEGLVEARTASLIVSNEQLRREIVERQEAETAREALRRKLLHAQEEERRRIARELHDQMGQNLTALNIGLKSLLDDNSRSNMPSRVERLQELATQTARDLHRVAVELRPAALDDLGLVKAIRNLLETWSTRCSVDVDFEATQYDATDVSPEIETTLYRVVQEALNNIAKHSGANRVGLLVRRTRSHVQAIIEDDGRGFDTALASAAGNGNGRLGLLGMQERLGTVGGTLKVESTPGSGATLIAQVPIVTTG